MIFDCPMCIARLSLDNVQLSVCVYVLQRSHFGCGSAMDHWRLFLAAESAMCSAANIHTRFLVAVGLFLPGFALLLAVMRQVLWLNCSLLYVVNKRFPINGRLTCEEVHSTGRMVFQGSKYVKCRFIDRVSLARRGMC